MDLSDFILGHAAFAPDKPAVRFEGRTLTYAALAERIEAAARALKSELGIGRGDRVAVLAVNHPDTLVLLYACARLGAMLVPLNWRLAVQEQLFILTDASVSALVVEEAFAATIGPLREALPKARVVGIDFAPPNAVSFEHLFALGSGQGRVPQVDLSSSLLVVYTSGTTGRPKGAVLRQEALFWNGVMSQHMHGLTADDHVLTVLPLFHVGGLNIQTTPALHHGATVTLHPRFAPEKTLAAIAQDRPTLTVLVPATMQAFIEHPAYADTDLSSLRALTTGSTTVPQPLIDAFERRGVPVLQVYGSTETCPIAIYTSAVRRPLAPGLDRPAGPRLRGEDRRRCRPRAAARNRRRDRPARPEPVLRVLGRRRSDGGGVARRLVLLRRCRDARRATAMSSSTTAGRTSSSRAARTSIRPSSSACF